MNLYAIIGGEYIDARYPDSATTFHFSIYANSVEDAKDGFATIFPGCWIESIKLF